MKKKGGFVDNVVDLGDKNAMGVFIWATNSDIDLRVRGWPIVEMPGANFSAMDTIDMGQTS